MKKIIILILTCFLCSGLFAKNIYSLFSYNSSYDDVLKKIKSSDKKILTEAPDFIEYETPGASPFFSPINTVLYFDNGKLINMKESISVEKIDSTPEILFLSFLGVFTDTYELLFYNTSLVNNILSYEFTDKDKRILVEIKVFIDGNLMTREYKVFKP